MPSINIEELLEIEQENQVPHSSPIRTSRQEFLSHQFFFDEPFGDPKMYRGLINLLYTANEHVEFDFIFNSPGGQMISAISIIEAIRSTHATVRAIIVGECHSAASVLALHCHEILVTESAHMLVHSAQFGTGGFTQNVKAHADFSTVYVNRLLDNSYKGFLTDQELTSVKAGVEMWFTSDQIIERLKNRRAFKEKKLSQET